MLKITVEHDGQAWVWQIPDPRPNENHDGTFAGQEGPSVVIADVHPVRQDGQWIGARLSFEAVALMDPDGQCFTYTPPNWS